MICNRLRAVATFVALTAAAAAQQRAPAAQCEPKHLAVDVDGKEVKQLTVKFDVDMDPSAHAICGGGPSFPPVLHTAWKDARTFVVDVDLAPGSVYSMDLACAGSAGFRSRDGAMLPPTPWRFATKGQPFAAGEADAATTRLFAALRDHYSYRDRLGIDWNAVERTHRDELVASSNGAALAVRFSQVLATAQDPHITVRWQEALLPTWQRDVRPNFDVRGLRAVLPKLARVGRAGIAGRTEDGIGYLLVPTFAREQQEEFDQVLQALRAMADAKAVVLDLRNNMGGDELLAKRLAGFFVRDDRVYATHRVRDPKAPGGFSLPQERRVRANPAPDVFAGPVAVLMGPLNMSSCEAFLLMMKQAPQAVLVGATSYGSSGNPQPHAIAPSLAVMLPSWEALLPDGSALEGSGVSPHIHVETTPKALEKRDAVLDAALERLRGR